MEMPEQVFQIPYETGWIAAGIYVPDMVKRFIRDCMVIREDKVLPAKPGQDSLGNPACTDSCYFSEVFSQLTVLRYNPERLKRISRDPRIDHPPGTEAFKKTGNPGDTGTFKVKYRVFTLI